MSAQYRFDRSLTVAAWLIVLLLAVIAFEMVRPQANPLAGVALAQQGPMVGARGVFAFPMQLTPRTYGVCMWDVDAGTIWFYEYGVKKLQLVGARSWIYDRYLEEYNVEGLGPHEVGQLVGKQRSRRQPLEASGVSTLPDATDQTPGAGPDARALPAPDKE